MIENQLLNNLSSSKDSCTYQKKISKNNNSLLENSYLNKGNNISLVQKSQFLKSSDYYLKNDIREKKNTSIFKNNFNFYFLKSIKYLKNL